MGLVLFNLLFAVKLKYCLTITIVDDVKWNTWHFIVVPVTLYAIIYVDVNCATIPGNVIIHLLFPHHHIHHYLVTLIHCFVTVLMELPFLALLEKLHLFKCLYIYM